MLSLFKSKNSYAQPAKQVYGSVLEQVRLPKYYKDFGVPDSFDGRFDLMLLYIFLVLNRMLGEGRGEAEAFNQAVFDAAFADMDQTLREMGIGDMGVPKHMRKMMKAFNGRMNAYEVALKEDDLEDALGKNLYGTLDAIDPKHIAKMAQKVHEIITVLAEQDNAEILQGCVRFEG